MPDGDQSDPSVIRMPALWAATTSVVTPYSQRLENGDHTIVPAWGDQRSKSCCVSAVQWTAMSSERRPSAVPTASNSLVTTVPGRPSAQW